MSQPVNGLYRNWCRGAAAYLVLLLALVPTGIVYFQVRAYVAARDRARFDEVVRLTQEKIEERITHHADELLGLRGLFAADRKVEWAEWESYVASLELPRRYPGLRAFGYAQRVDHADRAGFVSQMRQSIAPDFEIFPAGNREFYFPMIYMNPFEDGAKKNLGWDGYSEPARRAAMDEAGETGKSIASSRVQMMAGDGTNLIHGFVIFSPIFKSGAPVKSGPERRAALQGFVSSAFLPEKLLDGSFPRSRRATVSVEIFDGAELASENLLYASRRPSKEARPLFSQTVPISVIGRTWSLRFTTLPSFESDSEGYLPLTALAGGLVFALMLFRIARVQVEARASAERLNGSLIESEDKLRETNRRLEVEITGHRAADEKLAYERDLLHTMMDYSPDRIYFKDKQSRFVRCGKAVLDGLGIDDPSVAIGKSDADFFSEEHARAACEDELHILRTGEPLIGKVEKESWKDGREAWVLTNKMPWRDERGNIIGTFGISKDITALKRAERDLAAEKELLSVTLRAIGDGVITTDTESRIVLFNTVAEQLTGWIQADAVGRPVSGVYRTLNEQTRETDTCLLRKAIATGIVVSENHPTLLITRDGDERNISETAAPILDHLGKTIGAVLVFRDISKRLKTEAERQKTSKLESIGLLAGGIAHDFNNILTVILGNISLAHLGDGSGQSMRAALQEAEKASMRARELTRKLLTFARGGSPIKKPIQFASLLQDWTQLAVHGAGLTAEFSIAENLQPVDVDEGQISQVIHNLVRHARLSSLEGGKIEVRAENRSLADGAWLLLPAGSYVIVSIRDFGKGLGPEQVAKIFDPYFSSKKLDTGLELATAYSIVRKHGGQIKVESTLEQGTTFHVYLPAASQPVAAPKPVIARKPVCTTGRVLVMDDEPAIRKLACHMLEKSGWKVGLARDGAEAIELYQAAKQEGKPYAAVILDLSVPNGMGGKECIRELKLLDPEVKAIVCSGYFNDPVMANYRDYGFRGVVPKPYGTQELVLALTEVSSSGPELQADLADRCVSNPAREIHPST